MIMSVAISEIRVASYVASAASTHCGPFRVFARRAAVSAKVYRSTRPDPCIRIVKRKTPRLALPVRSGCVRVRGWPWILYHEQRGCFTEVANGVGRPRSGRRAAGRAARGGAGGAYPICPYPPARRARWVGTTSRGPTGGRVPSWGNLITNRLRTRQQQGSQIMHRMQGYQSTDLGT